MCASLEWLGRLPAHHNVSWTQLPATADRVPVAEVLVHSMESPTILDAEEEGHAADHKQD